MIPTTEALCTALADALMHYPMERKAILRGFELALEGAVTLQPTGIHHVTSASFPGEYYHTTLLACTCRAVAKAPGGRCKHRFATALTILATQGNSSPVAQQSASPAWAWSTAPVESAGLAAQICDPDYRVRRELTGFSGPTPRHQ